MKILLNDNRIQTVTRERGAELINQGLGVAYTGEDPEDAAVKEAIAEPEKAAERVEVVHYHTEEAPPPKKKKSRK